MGERQIGMAALGQYRTGEVLCHPAKHSNEVMDAIGILSKCRDWSIHDAPQPYLNYLDTKHGLRLIHFCGGSSVGDSQCEWAVSKSTDEQ
jgi:hypothetical protein